MSEKDRITCTHLVSYQIWDSLLGLSVNMLRVIDLFCGAGGFSLGFENHRFGGGFRTVLALDNDEAAVGTYRKNFESPVTHRRIEDWLKGKPRVPRADVVIGGPPCQGYSKLNRNRKGDDRRSLWQEFLQVVEVSGAPIFIMENVTPILRSAEFQLIIVASHHLGFNVEAYQLNSADYGVPQKRVRAFIVGWRPGRVYAPTKPPPTHAEPGKGDGLPEWLTVGDAILDLPKPEEFDVRHCAPPLDLHFARKVAESSLSRYRHIPEGGNRFDLIRHAPHLCPRCWKRKPKGSTDVFGRLKRDEPSLTIRTEFFKPEKGRYLHPIQHRALTHREAARLMGFPDDFVFHGAKLEIARQIGNAVPPPLAGAVSRMARRMIRG